MRIPDYAAAHYHYEMRRRLDGKFEIVLMSGSGGIQEYVSVHRNEQTARRRVSSLNKQLLKQWKAYMQQLDWEDR